MDIELVEVLWKYGKFPASKLPQIANKELMKGNYGDATAKIAGMVEPDDGQIGDLFERSILEINNKFIDDHHSTLVLAKGIVNNQVEPYEGLSVMAILYQELGQPAELKILKSLFEEYSEYLPPKYNAHLKENKLIAVFKKSCEKDIISASGELLMLSSKF
jgi:hypothetical protein